jgi:hypothetical protein
MRTRNTTGNEDNNFFRCKRCGFPCDLSRDKTGPGSGLNYVEISHTTDTAPDDPQVIAGCPMCGTKNYKNWQQ